VNLGRSLSLLSNCTKSVAEVRKNKFCCQQSSMKGLYMKMRHGDPVVSFAGFDDFLLFCYSAVVIAFCCPQLLFFFT